MSFEDFLKKAIGHGLGKKIKSIKPTQEEQDAYMALEALAEVAKKARARHGTEKDYFWAGVERRTGLYSNPMKWNAKTGEIDIYEEHNHNSAILKGPFHIGDHDDEDGDDE